MKLKKILSICLVGALAATLLTACSDSGEVSEEEVEEVVEEIVEEIEAEEAGDDTEAEAEAEAEGDAEEAEVGDYGVSFTGFPETITIEVYAKSNFTPAGVDEVVDAINAISIPAINVELDLTVMEVAAYSEQIGLMFAGGDSFDLLMVGASGSSTATSFAEMYANNELMDISELAEEYAPEALEVLGDFANPFRMGDGLYALPAFKIYNSNEYIIMRTDILDYLGLTAQAEAISSWSDYEAIVEAVYEAQDELPEDLQTTYMIAAAYNNGMVLPYNGYDNSADDFSEHYGFDTLGDGNTLYIVDDDGTVKCWYETESFQEIIARCRDWYTKGWVDKDAANTLTVSDSSMANGATFSYMQHSQVGVESAKKLATGYDLLCIECNSSPITTANVTGFTWGVPVTASEPEAAVAFLNLCYVNPEIENLFVYGIEGRDFEINDEGEAIVLDDNVYQQSDFWFPNQFISYPSEGEGSDFRETSLEQMLAADLSPYYGFNIDLTPVENENAAVAAVVTQYAPTLSSGTIDPSESYDDFITALYDAGMQTLLDYFQQELDAWVAEH